MDDFQLIVKGMLALYIFYSCSRVSMVINRVSDVKLIAEPFVQVLFASGYERE